MLPNYHFLLMIVHNFLEGFLWYTHIDLRHSWLHKDFCSGLQLVNINVFILNMDKFDKFRKFNLFQNFQVILSLVSNTKASARKFRGAPWNSHMDWYSPFGIIGNVVHNNNVFHTVCLFFWFQRISLCLSSCKAGLKLHELNLISLGIISLKKSSHLGYIIYSLFQHIVWLFYIVILWFSSLLPLRSAMNMRTYFSKGQFLQNIGTFFLYKMEL